MSSTFSQLFRVPALYERALCVGRVKTWKEKSDNDMPDGSFLGFFPRQFKSFKVRSSNPRGLYFHHKLFRKCAQISDLDQVSSLHGQGLVGGQLQPFPKAINNPIVWVALRLAGTATATAGQAALSHSPLSSCRWAPAPRFGQMCAYNALPSSQDHLQVHTHSARPRTDHQCLCHPTIPLPLATSEFPLYQDLNEFLFFFFAKQHAGS